MLHDKKPARIARAGFFILFLFSSAIQGSVNNNNNNKAVPFIESILNHPSLARIIKAPAKRQMLLLIYFIIFIRIDKDQYILFFKKDLHKLISLQNSKDTFSYIKFIVNCYPIRRISRFVN